jgi:hypothetical protein
LWALRGEGPRSRIADAFKGGAATIFGVLLLAVASVILPNEVLFSFGIVILFANCLLWPRDGEADETLPAA